MTKNLHPQKPANFTFDRLCQDLHSLKNESLAIVKELKEGLWIGRGTRFIAIDFTVYNANINLFCITT